MKNTKLVVPLRCQFKLRKNDLNESKSLEIKKYSYAYGVGSFMYDMVCTKLNISYIVRIVNWHLSNPSKEH